MNATKIVLIRCPQPTLVGETSGSLYSPNRLLTPEPTLPQLEGIIKEFSKRFDVPINVIQLDLRYPANGPMKTVCYGSLKLHYINEKINKIYSGVDIESLYENLADADFIGFTNNFCMSRIVVAEHIRKVRDLFPAKELWVGGRDVFTERVIKVYANAAGNRNFIVFDGHVFDSLPAYLLWKIKNKGRPFGITIYDEKQKISKLDQKPLLENANKDSEIKMPLPVYYKPKALGYFTGSGEGQPNPPFSRFVYMTISIGCPYACGYCTTGQRERYLVHKDLFTIKKELEMYKRLGVTTIGIIDDNLLALGPEKVKRIMNLINSYGFEIEYGNGLQLSLLNKYWDELKNPIFERCISLYAPLEDLTCDRLYEKLDPIALELELMKKIVREKPGSLRYVTMGVIIGVPGHTKKALETAFMKNIGKFLNVFFGSKLEVAVTVFNFMPLPGTHFGETALNSSRMVMADPISKDPEVCSFGTTSYAPEGISHKKLFELYEKALNLNPAGKELGVSYVKLQRLGKMAVQANERGKVPAQWRIPGFHLRARVKEKL